VPPPVLADPSGRRARLLARAGRAVAIVCLLWLAGLVLAGLGILPASVLPLGRAVAGQAAPPVLHVLSVRPGTASDLAPALRARRAGGAGRSAAHAGGGTQLTAVGVGLVPRGGRRSHGGAPSGKGGPSAPTTTGRVGVGKPNGAAPTTAGSRGAAGTIPSAGATTTVTKAAPGQTTKQTTPGHTKTTAPGNSGSAPGQVKQTTTTTITTSSPGQSGSAPGQTVTHGTGHGHGA
jgi:hypothetical protein